MTKLALTAIALLAATAARAGDVVVQVDGIADASGRIQVAACTEAEFMGSCAISAIGPARVGRVSLTLRGVPPGRYAIQAHHDRDSDGRIGRNLIGIPTEGVGFSRNPSMAMGPPSFGSAAVDVGEAPLSLRIMLAFEPKD